MHRSWFLQVDSGEVRAVDKVRFYAKQGTLGIWRLWRAVELGENLEGTDPVAAPHRDCMAAF